MFQLTFPWLPKFKVIVLLVVIEDTWLSPRYGLLM
jgi:hypothetical protein